MYDITKTTPTTKSEDKML